VRWVQVLTDTIHLLSGALGQLATAFDEGVEGGRGVADGGVNTGASSPTPVPSEGQLHHRYGKAFGVSKDG
jgi:hypothetical protein